MEGVDLWELVFLPYILLGQGFVGYSGLDAFRRLLRRGASWPSSSSAVVSGVNGRPFRCGAGRGGARCCASRRDGAYIPVEHRKICGRSGLFPSSVAGTLGSAPYVLALRAFVVSTTNSDSIQRPGGSSAFGFL
jgi:hypothetical protein